MHTDAAMPRKKGLGSTGSQETGANNDACNTVGRTKACLHCGSSCIHEATFGIPWNQPCLARRKNTWLIPASGNCFRNFRKQTKYGCIVESHASTRPRAELSQPKNHKDHFKRFKLRKTWDCEEIQNLYRGGCGKL